MNKNLHKIGNVADFNIYATKHASKRMKQRKIDTYQVVSIILAFGELKLKEFAKTETEIFCIDKVQNISVVFCVDGTQIRIITVINKSNCYVRDNTIVTEINL